MVMSGTARAAVLRQRAGGAARAAAQRRGLRQGSGGGSGQGPWLQGSDRFGFRVRDSTLRANVSKASRRSPSPMLESVPPSRRRAVRVGRRRGGCRPERRLRARRSRGAAWVSWMRPTVPGPRAAFTRSRRSGISIWSCGACAPLTASGQEAAGRPAGAGEPQRGADRGELGAGDLRPERAQPRLGEAALGGGGAHLRLDQAAGADEAALAFPAVGVSVLGHARVPLDAPSRLTAPARLVRENGWRPRTRRDGTGAPRLVRPARRGCCPGARRRARARGPIPMRSGSPR